jgi:glycosyltransferase involved in cell wall biosynthesis
MRQWDKLRHKLGRDYGKRWRRLTASFQPDVVVVCDPGSFHFLSDPGFFGYYSRSPVRVVTISQFNKEGGSLPSHLYHRARAFDPRVAARVFVSRRNLEVARAQLCLELENSHVLDNPPDLADHSPLPFPAGDSCRFAMVARLECDVKGQDIVLRALSQSVWRSREWTLSLVGDGPDRQYLTQLVAHLGLGGRVRLTGQVSDVRQTWKSHSVLLMCSLAEGKPLALTEAMLCARPAVVTDVGGNAELVQEGVTGFIAESATVESFSRALERAWECKGRWRAIGMKAHQSVADRLQPPPHQRLLEIIESVVARSQTHDLSQPEPPQGMREVGEVSQ